MKRVFGEGAARALGLISQANETGRSAAPEGLMRSLRTGLWACFLGVMACSGQNVVAGEGKSKSEQLGSSLPSWCSQTCAWLRTCDVEAGCDCDGDECVCTPEIGDDCVEDCQEYMEPFTASDVCAAIGERMKDCIERAGCEGRTTANLCNLTAAEQQACPGLEPSTPEVTGGPNPMPGEGGAPGYNGPLPTGGTSYTAGSANLGDHTHPPAIQCQDGYGTGGGTGMGYPQLLCEEGHNSCSDGHDYLMYCVRTSEQVTTCSCLVDNQVVGGFDPGATCPTPHEMNTGCRWSLDVE